MSTRNVYIGSRREVEVICPECGRAWTLPVHKLQVFGKRIGARCICGTLSHVVFERRATFRKPTDLPGKVARNVGSELQLTDVKITDLSLRGLAMKVPKGSEIEVGEVLRVDIRLDDEEQTPIWFQVVVRNVSSRHVGAEFQALEEKPRRVLAFYLLMG